MENQHRQITGYRELTQHDIDLMNVVKGLGPDLAPYFRPEDRMIKGGQRI